MPVYFEAFAFDLVSDPEESHFRGSRALFFDGVVGNACRGLVVAVYWSWWLWVAEFGEYESEDDAFFDGHEKGA